MSVLPRASGLDEANIDIAIFDPVLNLLRYELWTIVALDNRRCSVEFDELLEDTNDLDRSQVPRALDSESSAGELIDHRQKPKRLSIGRLICHEVVTPHVVRVHG